LWAAQGRGGKARWQEEAMVPLESCLREAERTDNRRQ
jgi:hypothetical protein